jgi:hypothetical protein
MESAKTSTSTEIAEIQRQMALIRHDMHQEVQGAVRGARSLTDWRRLVKSHPWLSVSVASLVGYLIVPRRRTEKPTIVSVEPPRPELLAVTGQPRTATKPPTNRSNALGTAFSLLAPIVVRAAQNYALNYLERWLAQHPLPLAARDQADRTAGATSRSTRPDLAGRLRESR